MTHALLFSNNTPCFISSCCIGVFMIIVFYSLFSKDTLAFLVYLVFSHVFFPDLFSGIFSGLSLSSCSQNFSDPFLLTLVMFKRQVLSF